MSKAKISDGEKLQNNVSTYDEVKIEDDIFVRPA